MVSGLFMLLVYYTIAYYLCKLVMNFRFPYSAVLQKMPSVTVVSIHETSCLSLTTRFIYLGKIKRLSSELLNII